MSMLIKNSFKALDIKAVTPYNDQFLQAEH